jgi:hypothetical protein
VVTQERDRRKRKVKSDETFLGYNDIQEIVYAHNFAPVISDIQ